MSTVSKIKKGNKVIMVAFTGMKLGVFEVVAADKETITVGTKNGERVFDRKTGKQIEPEPKAPRFASSIIPDDGSYVAPVPGRKKKAEAETPKKATKKKKPEPEEVEEEEIEDDEEFDDDDFEEVE